MSPELVARARAVHLSLHANQAPDHVRYFYFSGSGHKTVTRINIDASKIDDCKIDAGNALVVTTADAGDGTVPMWSSLPRAVQKQIVVNEHANVFRGDPFKRVFFRLFGEDAGPPLEAAADAAFTLAVSLQRQIFQQGDPVEAVLSSEIPFTMLRGKLVFEMRTEDDDAGPEVKVVEISYQGPAVATLSLSIEANLPAGFYELRYEGDRTQQERVVFAVSRNY